MVPILEVKNLRTQYKTESGLVKAVDGVSYYINEQEIVGVVGESGCGKSVTQLSVMRLINSPGEIVGGEILFEGQNLLQFKANGPEMRRIRGAKISMVFQEPMTSLNPVLTIGQQLIEILEVHLGMSRKNARQRVIEMLDLVGIPGASSRIDDYPHNFSGGMRQRVMIAMALLCNPKLIIADEPTTALDVTTQAQLFELMKSMVERFKSSLVIVTHNLGIVARYAHRIYIMYAGRIVEEGSCKEIFRNPRHPYTIGLLKSVPRLDDQEGKRLVPIEGMPPDLIQMPSTCAFLPRCSYSIEQCRVEPWPELRKVEGTKHYVRCYLKTEAWEQCRSHSATT
ncbi:MAG: ABC transporter ATP-binding protein [Clostridia bacterium]|nr:ABC transporter ATP-binding protein [Clostridia bacterium]